MTTEDVRWQQRLVSYKKALSQLTKFVEKGDLNELEEQGLIKAFEYTYELGWNVVRDFLINQGNTKIFGSRDAIREGFRLGLIEDGEGWMEMLKDRNRSSHTYNQETADEIAASILSRYFPLFVALQQKMDELT